MPFKVNISGFGRLNPSFSVDASRWKAASMLVTLTSEFPKCIEFLEDSPWSFPFGDSALNHVCEVCVVSRRIYISLTAFPRSRALSQASYITDFTCASLGSANSVASSFTACCQTDSSSDASSGSHCCSNNCCFSSSSLWTRCSSCFLDYRFNLCSARSCFAFAFLNLNFEDTSVDDACDLIRLTVERLSFSSGTGLFRSDIHW